MTASVHKTRRTPPYREWWPYWVAGWLVGWLMGLAGDMTLPHWVAWVVLAAVFAGLPQGLAHRARRAFATKETP